MSRVIGHTVKDAGHVDHVPFDPANPDHDGMARVRVVEGIIVPADVPLPAGVGHDAVVTAEYPTTTVLAHLDCEHTVVVEEHVPNPNVPLALSGLDGLVSPELLEQVRAELGRHGQVDCPEGCP